MRRRSFVHLALLAAVIAAAATAVAVAIPWLPVSASKEREGIDLTYWLATAIAIMIFAVVSAAILYSVWRFRVHPDDDRDGPPIHGHTGLEIVWTAIPTALVTAIAIVSAIVLHDNGTFGKDPLVVKVTAEQFTWVFTYENGPAKGVVSPNLYLPLDRTAKLNIESRDVLHSFWVPEFGQKQDAVPGRVEPAQGHADEAGHVSRDLHRALRPRPLADAAERDRAHGQGVRVQALGGRGQRRAAARVAAPGSSAAERADRRDRGHRRHGSDRRGRVRRRQGDLHRERVPELPHAHGRRRERESRT